jgi:hypothetical protein
MMVWSEVNWRGGLDLIGRDTDKERHSGSGSVGLARWLERIETTFRVRSEYRAGKTPKRSIFSSLETLEISPRDLLSCHVHDALQLCFAASDTRDQDCGCEVAEVVVDKEGLRISTFPRNQYLTVQGSLHYHQS